MFWARFVSNSRTLNAIFSPRPPREGLADDVVAVAHVRRVRDVRVLRASARPAPHGQPKALRAALRAHRLQPSTDHLQYLDILRSEYFD